MHFITVTRSFGWLALAVTAVAVILLCWTAWHLPQPRWHALLGCVAMTCMLLLAVVSFLLFAPRASAMSQLLLPVLTPALIAGLYRLTFPLDSPDADGTRAHQHRQILLALLMSLAFVSIVCLEIVEFLW